MRRFILASLTVKKLYISMMIVGSFFVISPVFAQVCAVTKAGRLQSVTFTSGKKITVIGHEHGQTSEVMNLESLAGDTKNSNAVYLTNASRSLIALHTTLQHYREDVAAIKELVRSGDLNYVAVEWGDEIAEIMKSRSRWFLPMARENLKARGFPAGLPAETLLDDAFLIYATPALYLTHKEPEVLKNVKIVSVENENLMERSLKAIAERDARLQSFFAKTNVTDEIKGSVKQLSSRAIMEYDLHRFLEDDWVFDLLKSEVPLSLVESAKDVIRPALEAAELLRQRDALASQKILTQRGSGVLLIGSAHSRSMAEILRKTCLSEVK